VTTPHGFCRGASQRSTLFRISVVCTWPYPSGLQDEKHPLEDLEGAFMFSDEGAARLANNFLLSQQSGYRVIRRGRAAER